MRRQTLPLLLRQLLQNVQYIRGVHAGEYLRRPRLRQGGETAGGVVQIREYRCQRRYVHQPEHPLPLGVRQQGEGLRHIALVVALEQLGESRTAFCGADGRRDLLRKIVSRDLVHHVCVLLWHQKWAQKCTASEIVATARRLRCGAEEHDKTERGQSMSMDDRIRVLYFRVPQLRLRPVLPQLSMNIHLR